MSLRKSIAAALWLTATTMISGTAGAAIDIGVSINVAPPELPVYEQPAIPAPGYIWTPGYWAWGGDDYYWVPGTWVLAAAARIPVDTGLLGLVRRAYLWHQGYWGPHVGFYGGVDYGYGYGGNGYEGGEWRWRHVLLQPQRQQHSRKCPYHQRLQPHRGQQRHGQSRQLQRWQRRCLRPGPRRHSWRQSTSITWRRSAIRCIRSSWRARSRNCMQTPTMAHPPSPQPRTLVTSAAPAWSVLAARAP